MLEEAGGEFMALHVCVPHVHVGLHVTLLMYPRPTQHSDLRQMLLETARELGAEARTNAEVVEIAEDCRSVRHYPIAAKIRRNSRLAVILPELRIPPCWLAENDRRFEFAVFCMSQNSPNSTGRNSKDASDRF